MSELQVVAIFDREADLLAAVKRLRGAETPIVDVYSPYPIHGLDALLGRRRSRLGRVTFVAGSLGALTAFAFQLWTSAVSWPVNIGGKPNASILAFIPITFEITILTAGLATVGAFLGLSRLFPGATVRESQARVTDDQFAVVLRAADESSLAEVRSLVAEENACGVDVRGSLQ